MNSCEHFQQHLLDDLYGLLEEADGRTLRDHILDCTACRTAQDRALAQQRLLAAAAKDQFAGVRFIPPPETTPASRPEQPRARLPARRLVRWAMAAAVLMVASCGVIGGIKWVGYAGEVAQARQTQDQALGEKAEYGRKQAEDRDRAARDLRDIQEQIQLLETKWTGEAKEVERAVNSRELQVIITGPKTLQPGAPNRYQIQTRDRNNAPKNGTVHVGVVDATSHKEFFRRDLESVAGNAVLDLPRDLPLTPGSQLALLVTAEAKDGVQARVSEPLPLVAPLFLTHLATDRPMYRPGEVVRFRSLTLDRFSLKPVQEDLQLRYQIADPLGAEVFKLEGSALVARAGAPVNGPDGKVLRGIGAGEFQIPPGAPGGEYTLVVSETHDRFPAEKRKFLVNQYQAPRLNKELEFSRKSYGTGEEVEARCKVARVEGGAALVNQPIVATVHVDGQPCAVQGASTLRTDPQGKVPPVRFKLPERIERGEGTLAVQFTDGANHETIVRPIPIVLRKLQVEYFPEGGDLVAGAPNRVYFQARTTLNKPAELSGRLVDAQGNTVTSVQTLNDEKLPGVNQGMGVFTFVPRAGQAYELKIDVPIGIEGRYPLPAAKSDGVILSVPEGVVTDKIDAVLHNVGRERALLVGVYCRGRLLDHARVVSRANEMMTVPLKPAASVSGVYRVTVFEEPQGDPKAVLKPVAERLIYRRAAEQLHLGITADKAKYSPGQRVTLSFRALDEREKIAPAVLLVRVVDQAILQLADEKTARNMPTQFYLGTEVRKAEDLEYADFLLTDHPKATAALDLLLGTQGWRRFAEQDPGKFRQKERQDADRLLVASGQSSPQVANLAELEVKKVDEKFAPRYVELQTRLAVMETVEEQRAVRVQGEEPRFGERITAAQADLRAARTRLDDFYQAVLRIGGRVGLVLLLIIGLGGLVVGLVRAIGEQRPALPYFVTGCTALLLVSLGVVNDVFRFLPTQMDAPRGAEANVNQAGEMNAPHPAILREELAAVRGRGGRGGGGGRPLAAPGPGGRGGANALGDARDEKFVDQMQLGLLAKRKNAPAPEVDKKLDVLRLEQLALPGLLPKGEPVPANGMGLWRAVLRDAEQAKEARGGKARDFGNVLGTDWDMATGRDKDLRRQGQFQELMQKRMRRNVALPPTPQPLVVREYAHLHQGSADKVRRDFAETVYWNPVFVLTNGKGEATFELPDSTTTFEVLAWGHTLDGRLGTATTEVVSRLPFSLEPKIPMEVTSSDKVTIPVAVANDGTSKRAVAIHAEAAGLAVVGSADREVAVGADRPVRQLFQFQPTLVEGLVSVCFRGSCEPFGTDSVERTFKVVPEGFPVTGAQSDMLEGTAQSTITLPESWVKGTLKCQAQVFPSTLAALQKGLEGLLREPGGCFEQTSSSNYPNVLILNYLKESSQTRPEIEQRARALLASGYRQLLQFECESADSETKRKGYEWFGGSAPAHESLTAYGLLEFRDMAKVHPVDAAMIERTRQYLLARRDGKGGFQRNPRALDTFGRAPDHITTAYIVWALTEGGGADKLDTELNALAEQAKTSKDPYFLALVGNSLLNRGRTDEGVALLKALTAAQKADGHLEGAQTSITGSGGRDLEIETTALATLAWLRANRPADFHGSVDKAVRWIGQQRGGYGGFGSTQSTILALKALIAFTRENRKTAEAGDLKLFLGDAAEPVAATHFAAGTLDPVLVSVPREDLLHPGKNKMRVEITGKNAFPYTLSWSYQTLKPANEKDCPVHLTTKLDRTTANEGETVRLTAVVENKSGKGQGMAVAILGLPGGLSLPEDMRQLKELARPRDNDTKAGVISAFEVRGRELVLYWRDLAPDQKIEVNLDLICRIPGEYRGPASRAYLYYNADHKYWVEPLATTVTPRPE